MGETQVMLWMYICTYIYTEKEPRNVLLASSRCFLQQVLFVSVSVYYYLLRGLIRLVRFSLSSSLVELLIETPASAEHFTRCYYFFFGYWCR